MLQETLAEALASLEALIADASPRPGGDLLVLRQEVADDVAGLANERSIDVVMAVRGRGSLAGRDLRRWRYVLTLAVTSFLEDLPAGSGVHVDIACVATTSGHRWLQADVAARLDQAGGNRGPEAEPPTGGGRQGLILVGTALRLFDGACHRTATADGPVLRLVAPVEA